MLWDTQVRQWVLGGRTEGHPHPGTLLCSGPPHPRWATDGRGHVGVTCWVKGCLCHGQSSSVTHAGERLGAHSLLELWLSKRVPHQRRGKEATVSPEAVLGFSHARGSWIGPNAKQVLSGVANPTQRCTDQQGPALLLEHTNRSVQHTQHSLKETQTGHGRVGGWAGTRGSGMGWRGHQRGHEEWLRCQTRWSSGASQPQADRCKPGPTFFCNFSQVYSPLPCTRPSSSRSAPSLPSLALCKLWPQLLAALGPSRGLEIAKRHGPGKPGDAPGLQEPWVGRGSGVWWQSFPRRNSPFASPWTRLQGALELCSPPLTPPPPPPFLQSIQPATAQLMLQPFLGSVVHLHLDAQLALVLAMS